MSGKKKKKREKKAKAKMNGMTTNTTKTTDKTTVKSKTDIQYVKEKATTESNNERTENTDSEYESVKSTTETNGERAESTDSEYDADEETTSAASSDEEITPATALKRKTNVLSPPEIQPKSKIINLNTTELTPEEEKSLELTDSDRLKIVTSESSDNLNSTQLTAMDVSGEEPRESLQNEENRPKIPSYTLVLPSLKEMMDKEGLEGKTKEDRIAKKGNYARAVLNSPLASRKHTREKERQHQEREKQKSLYCTYETAEGNTEFFSNIELLQATARHIGRENIHAFYKIREGIFIVVLINSEIKGTFPQETNFQGEIREKKVNFRLLHNKPDNSRGRRRNQGYNNEDTVYLTLFLPTLVSDAAVKRLFTEFGEVSMCFPDGTKKKTGSDQFLMENDMSD